MTKLPGRQEIIDTHLRIKKYIHNTPIMTSRQVNELARCDVFFKCENFQRMGAFKMRGATNAILQLSTAEKQKGVATHSSGNFAQALSLACKNIRYSCAYSNAFKCP